MGTVFTMVFVFNTYVETALIIIFEKVLFGKTSLKKNIF